MTLTGRAARALQDRRATLLARAALFPTAQYSG